MNATTTRSRWSSARILYALDLAGVAVFAVSGALAAGRAGLDWFGVIVLATLPAIGGGTLRDLLLGRQPIFWVADSTYPWVICATAVATIVYTSFLPVPAHALLIADALGLALFAITGAQLAERTGHAPIIVVMMGTMTGVAGGVLRDVLSGSVPMILKKDIYATAAIAGIVLYLVAQCLGVERRWAMALGLVTVAALRLVSVVYDWQLPTFKL
ncbi:MAG: trimeric intracellular cation channel family protein [Rudaea sp.]|nr:trimeric intracellular cation channel family protein [Rudaea sp.]